MRSPLYSSIFRNSSEVEITDSFISARAFPALSVAKACALPHRPPSLRRRAVLPSRKPGVLGSRTLRRTEKVRLRSEPLWLPGGTTICTI